MMWKWLRAFQRLRDSSALRISVKKYLHLRRLQEDTFLHNAGTREDLVLVSILPENGWHMHK